MAMGWTQRWLGDSLGVTRMSVAHWEQGRAPVPKAVSKAVLRARAYLDRALGVLAKT